MKAPEMPGRIMAQIAMAPDSMMNHHVSGVSVGVAMVIHHAAAAPTRHAATVRTFQCPICLATSSAEATISPEEERPDGDRVVREQVSHQPRQREDGDPDPDQHGQKGNGR